MAGRCVVLHPCRQAGFHADKGLAMCCLTRLVFAGGASLAYALAVGHGARGAAGAFLDGGQALWAAAAAAGEAAAREEACLAEAVRDIDAWAAETGEWFLQPVLVLCQRRLAFRPLLNLGEVSII